LDPYLVLLRAGFTIATVVTNRAVRSYRTFSPLPENRRFPFCCTFRGLTPPRCYLAPWPVGARTFLCPRCGSDRPTNSSHRL